jgi:hypothetical protein
MRLPVSCIVASLVALFFQANPTSAYAQQSPKAEEILRAARMSPTARPASLRAQIRGEEKQTPLLIGLKDHVITYEFKDPDQTLLLKLDPGNTRLLEKKNGVTQTVSGTRLHDVIRNTGVTYQDLSLGFLYWPHPILQGEEKVSIRPCWKIDLQAPADEEIYGVARVWIDKEFGGILKIEGFDRKGLLLRRFLLISPQKIDGLWMLKQMRIESFNPGNPDPVTRRYLEVLGKEDR